MSGDEVRQLARHVFAIAEEVRAVCARTASASGVHWQSLAADRFRGQLSRAAARARLAADAIDRAGTALCRHATALDAIPRWLPAGGLGPVPVIPALAGPVANLAARAISAGHAVDASVAAAPAGATAPGVGGGALAAGRGAARGRTLP